jgi:hypothetical protein
MKKQKVDVKLTFKKLTTDDLNDLRGGSMPATLDQPTYQCPTNGASCGGQDPVGTPGCDDTRGTGTGTFLDTYYQCGTRPSSAC